MQSVNTQGTKTFLAGGTILTYRRVKIKAGTTTTPCEVEHAGAGEACNGIALNDALAGEQVTVRQLHDNGTHLLEAADSFSRGAILYGAADGKVTDSANGTGQFIALDAAGANGDLIEGMVNPFLSTTAATTSLLDAGEHTAQTTLEAVIAEILAHIDTARKTLPIPLGAITKEDGTALSVFASEAQPSMGFQQVDNKEVVLRWNNHATPGAVAFSVPMPQDLDGGQTVEVHWLAAMSGATDTPVLEHECYFGAGDTDCAGADDEIDGGAAVTEYASAIAAADVPDAMPSVLTCTFKPKDGELGTDDLLVYGVWLEYRQAKLS